MSIGVLQEMPAYALRACHVRVQGPRVVPGFSVSPTTERGDPCLAGHAATY